MKEEIKSITAFTALLNKLSGKEVKIIKHEARDLDETILLLDEVIFKENTNPIDDYEPRYELKLIGRGLVETEDDDFEPLPGSSYEVALDDDSKYTFDGSHFYISSERGEYSIQNLSPKES